MQIIWLSGSHPANMSRNQHVRVDVRVDDTPHDAMMET
jgi:hypothetical protein